MLTNAVSRFWFRAALALFALAPATRALAAGPVYSPEALVAVGDRARETLALGATPVVIFDLDDTLINSRGRTARILAELSASPEGERLDPRARALLADLPLEAIAYELADTLARLGIDDPGILAAAQAFWKQRFFTSAYASRDLPVPAAPDYARWLATLGARLVYLTGRPAETMREGTVTSLEANEFPIDEQQAMLMMKPHVQDNDLEFKKASFARIATMGTVVGVFENEPANINAMHAAFPLAVAIFVDTIHSNRPEQPEPGIAWVRDFVSFGSLGFEGFAHDGLGL